ncbi:MAG: WG repeat-containing protein [Bacteroidales bacterium]|nr:WG repeat-containing protein [Bacteroidales bacterium]
MKRIALIVVCIAAIGQAFGQPQNNEKSLWLYPRDTIVQENNNIIEITPELSKEIILYSYVGITDNGLIGESNFIGDRNDNDYFDSHPEYWLFKVSESEHFSRETFPYNKYDVSSIFVNGYAIVGENDGDGYGSFYDMLVDYHRCKYALINKQGKICIPFKKYDMISYGVYEGLVTVCKDGKWGFANSDGLIKIKLQYENARHFSEGLAAVKKDGKWGYIDKSGNIKIPFQYTWAGDFKKGVAVVMSNGMEQSSSMNAAILAVGLVDHNGKSTFDILKDKCLLKEYQGPFTDENTHTSGYVKYTYYEDGNGNRIKHGYYFFYSDNYLVDGHYKDGEKFGQWVEEWYGKVWNNWYNTHFGITPFCHQSYDMFPLNYQANYNMDIDWELVSTIYLNGSNKGLYKCFNGNILSGRFENFTPAGEFRYNGKEIKVNDSGVIIDAIEYESHGFSGEIPFKIKVIFYKGVPVKVEEYDGSTGKRNVLFQYDGFTTVDEIKEVVSNGERLYRMGDFYYELEPKDPCCPFDLFDVNKYSKELAKDMSFILNLPASWPIEDIKSPQLNYFKKASREKIKSFEYPKYSKVFNSYSEYSQAYDLGEDMFKQLVDKKLKEKQDAAFNKNKHLFIGEKEFVSYYSQGEEVFNGIVNKRNDLYEDYEKKDLWFVDFFDYLNCTQRGSIDDEINVRRTVYTDDKNYFTGPNDFIKFYVQGKETLNAEIGKRQEEYNKCKMPDGSGNLFKDLLEFLPYYLQGDYTKEYAVRRFKYRMNDFASLNLKGALDSKKDDIKFFLTYLADCKAISDEAYPKMIEVLVSKNSKMIKEWDENGEFFVNEVEFYEAYITNDYKTILKNKKNK